MRETLKAIPRNVPLLGIFAFSLASVHALFQLFQNNALHPTPLYLVPAVLVELVTAWLVHRAVESVRVTTDTKASSRDKAFYGKVMLWCVILALPTLAVSVAANYYEFKGHLLLAPLFPACCVACAIALAVQHVKKVKVDERLAEERDKFAEKLAKLEAKSAKPAQVVVQTLTLEARRAQLLDIWRDDGGKSFAELAPGFGVSRQTISNDFAALRAEGKVKRNGRGVEVLITQ